MGPSTDFDEYGYVARMTPMRIIWGIKKRMRGKKPLTCEPRNRGYKKMERTDK